MARAVVKSLAQFGMVSDVAPFEMPPNAWTSARNVSFDNGGVAKSGNRSEVMVPSAAEVKKIYPKGQKVYYTTSTGIYEATGSNNNALKTGLNAPSPNSEWIITELSNVVVFTSDTNNPYYISPALSAPDVLPGWGKTSGTTVDWKAKGIRAYKNFLIAWGMTENSTEYSQRIRWSDIAQPSNVPNSWDAGDTTKSAGFNDLSEARGEIVDCLQLGDHFFIYTTKEVFQMDYTGGSDIFRFRKVFDNISILGVECVASIATGHMLVTDSDIIVHNGSTFTSIVDNKIKDTLYQAISNGNKKIVKVQHYPSANEVWVLYAASSTKYRDRAAVFNTLNETWTIRDLPNVSAVAYGYVPNTKSEVIDLQDYTFDAPQADIIINGIGQDFIKNSLFVATDTLQWWALDEGLTGTFNLPCSMEKRNIDFDEYDIPADVPKFVSTIWPQFQGQGTVWVSVGGSDDPYSQPRWKEARKFVIGKDKKVDFRVTGQYISVKFEAFEAEAWTLMSYAIDVMPRWKR